MARKSNSRKESRTLPGEHYEQAELDQQDYKPHPGPELFKTRRSHRSRRQASTHCLTKQKPSGSGSGGLEAEKNLKRRLHTEYGPQENLGSSSANVHEQNNRSSSSPLIICKQHCLPQCVPATRPLGIEDKSATTKRPKRNDIVRPNPRLPYSKQDFIKAWLSTTGTSQSSSMSDKTSPRGLDVGEMDVPPSLEPPTTVNSSSRSGNSVKVHDADYEDHLGDRNIYIDSYDPPEALVLRTRQIIAQPRESPEIDEAEAKMVKNKSRELRRKNETDVIRGLLPLVIPGWDAGTDRRLEGVGNQRWSNFVPIPLAPSVIGERRPLPTPQPDMLFGYSKEAFTASQLDTIKYLTDQDLHRDLITHDPLKNQNDRSERNYAIPNKTTLFPFLNIEAKAEAKGGLHTVAARQAAGAGAIAMNGMATLTELGSGLDTLDYDEPQFFSLSIDHKEANVYVHWLSSHDGQIRFNMELLSIHLIKDPDGLRTLQRTVKNIYRWALNERIAGICKQLDKLNAILTIDRPPVRSKPLPCVQALDDPPSQANERALLFKKGDIIELKSKTADKRKSVAGWWEGRIKGGDGKWGLVPPDFVRVINDGEADPPNDKLAASTKKTPKRTRKSLPKSPLSASPLSQDGI